jgi:CRP-like cAMP-binding protein
MNDSELLSSVGNFSEHEVDMFKSHRQIRTFRKNEQILKIGEVCKSIYFLKKGAAVQFQNVDEIERIYIDLHVEHDWVINHKSFVSQSPSTNCIETFTDCEVVEITMYSIHRLFEMSQAFFQFNRLLNQVTRRLDFFDQNQSPVQRYNSLFRDNPEIIRTFPLKIIASYLKIAPETLSRIRSNY